MFDKSVYVNRRKQLIDKMSGGLVLILGNEEAPANYPSNTYKFRQDSSLSLSQHVIVGGFVGYSSLADQELFFSGIDQGRGGIAFREGGL